MHLAARICVAEIAPQRWRNGGGWTRQLLAWPPGAEVWQLRISLATIHAPGPFSAFPGVRRALALVSGESLLLTVDGQPHRLSVASDPLYFDGAAAAHAQPQGGESVDLNLMTRAGHGELLRVADAAPWTSPCPQRGLYSALAGTLHAEAGAPLPVPGDTLLWFSGAADLALQFDPDQIGATPRAWWLGYSPPA